jgi:hypothetical protein
MGARGLTRAALGRGAALPAALAVGLLLSATAQAAGPPQIAAAWSTEVVATSARLRAEINPEGSATAYHFNYLTEAAYQANLAANPPREGFAGAAKAPAGAADPSIGPGTAAVSVFQLIGALSPETAYRYRVLAHSTAGTVEAVRAFTTEALGGASLLLDGRGWEMVSPVDKNGGQVQGPGQTFGGGVLQAAASGEAVTYSSLASFGEGAQGAPTASQYISRRAAGGWSTENITTPALSGSYGDHPNGVPYQLFSGDLASGLLLNGEHCRGEGSGCPVENPPLPGSGAPPGYQDYYLRNDETGAFAALMTQADSPSLALSATKFNLALAGSSPDLRHVVLSTCAKLTPDASEVTSGGGGCEAADPNLYEWSGGALVLVNAAPGAELAAQGGAVSADGQRVYFTEGGKLWLREGAPAPHELAEGALFQTATPSGQVAFYTKGEHLFSYATATHSSTDLTPSGGVEGVLGASEDGTHVYYATAAGIFLRDAGTTTSVTTVAGAAQAGDYPPTTGTARTSPDGSRLAFLSTASLTGYDNTDQQTGQPDSEVYLYDAPTGGGEGTLTCASCNPTGERPLGPSTIPGAIANGEAPGATDVYKPRDLSADGRRLFFDSRDALVLSDTNKAPDVYQWEAQGEGSCQKPGGCVGLISGGRSTEGASFVDASADGSDALFLTDGSLVPSDPGSVDLYDAREGGGFPSAERPIECEGDACQPLEAEPEDPNPGTLLPSAGNPPLQTPKPRCPKGKHRVTRHGKSRCVPTHKKRHHARRGRRRSTCRGCGK